jgi:hypothetical protein
MIYIVSECRNQNTLPFQRRAPNEIGKGKGPHVNIIVCVL